MAIDWRGRVLNFEVLESRVLLAADLEPDRFEPNDTTGTATILGTLPAIALRDLTIHSESDVDYFNVTAGETGLLVVNAMFADDVGDLDLRVRDSFGNILASSETPNDNERLTLAVVAQQMYFVEMFGFVGATNSYDLEISSTPAPVPTAVFLDANDDTGVRKDDSVTNRELARVIVQTDLRQFQGFGIPILDAAGAEAQSSGAAVELFVNGNSVGFADPLFDATYFGMRFEPGELTDTGLPIGTPEGSNGQGYVNLVTAAVRIFDPRPIPFTRATALSDPLKLTFDASVPDPTSVTLGLLPSSDSGAPGDGMTNITQPALGGTAEASSQIRILATNVATGTVQTVGQGTVDSDASNGQPDGFGTWEITVEPLTDRLYDIVAQVEDLAGNITTGSTPLRIEIDTMAPNTPLLDLAASHDTGRHNDDGVTNIAVPLLSATSHDANASSHLQANNFIYRIFDRAESSDAVLIYDSFAVFGGYTNLGHVLTTANGEKAESILPALPDGTHHLKLEVEDRAGNVSDDFVLKLVIDTQAFLGTGRLHPDSDTGVPGFSDTRIDRITRDSVPSFYGVAEADNLVIVRVDGIRAGVGTAVPSNGNDAFQPPSPPNAPVQGNWQVLTNTALGEGQHTAKFIFEDLAGNQIATEPTQFTIDSDGPRVTDVTYGDIIRNGVVIPDENTTSLLKPRPSGGPDPLISSIVVNVLDGPQRNSAFRYDALFGELAREEGHFRLVGDANGNIPIFAAIPTFTFVADEPALAQVELVLHNPTDGGFLDGDDLGAPLPDDRYTLTIADRLVDQAGNPLDGESGAAGGQFVARFTVDSRPEIGTWASGSVWVDTNGNFRFDTHNPDLVNRDLVYHLGFTSDDVFSGNFAAGARSPADGFDKLGVYGRANGSFRWLVDTNNDGVPDVAQTDAANVNGLPVAGRFDGSDTNGDEVGVYTGSTWHFDTDHDFQVDMSLSSQLVGYPVVGDFDGDGLDDLGSWADNTFQIDLADGTRRGWDGNVDAEFEFGFAGVLERPIAADMDMDGFDDVGLWVPNRSGGTSSQQGEGTCCCRRVGPCWTVSSPTRFDRIRWCRSHRRR